jgi:hypothetical protein
MRSLKRWALSPFVVLAVTAVLAGIAGYAAAAPSDEQPTPSNPTAPANYVRGVIEQADATSLTIAAGAEKRTLRLTQATPIEALRPTTLDAVRAGDWLNAGTAPHAQTVFAITGLVVIPQANLEAPR